MCWHRVMPRRLSRAPRHTPPNLAGFSDVERRTLFALYQELSFEYTQLTTRKLWWIEKSIRESLVDQCRLMLKPGIDFILADVAKKMSIPVLGLEHQEHIYERLDKLPLDVQTSLLRATLSKSAPAKRHEFCEARKQLLEISERGWKVGNQDEFQQVVVQEMAKATHAEKVLNDALTDDRNVLMANAIMSHLKSRGTRTFAFGIAHFGGPGNVLERLKARGYTVKKIELGK